MLLFGVTFLATLPQRLEILEGLTNYPVFYLAIATASTKLVNQYIVPWSRL
jgi:hypothetical protein